MSQVFDYTDYKRYISDALEKGVQTSRGAKTLLANALQCQPSHVTRILTGKAHLSLEQAERASRYLGHTDEESVFFILLVEYGRAGTPGLRAHFRKQIQSQQQQALNLKNRFKPVDALTESAQNVYYGSWQYSAIHIALTVPEYQTPEALCRHFGIPARRVNEILQFLVKSGLAAHSRGKYQPTEKWIHLSKDSVLAVKHHANWRLQAIRALESQVETDLHYTATISASAEDIIRIKAVLTKALDEIWVIIKESKPEKCCGLLLDFFES